MGNVGSWKKDGSTMTYHQDCPLPSIAKMKTVLSMQDGKLMVIVFGKCKVLLPPMDLNAEKLSMIADS